MCSSADSQTDVGPIIATSIPKFKEVELYPKAIESLSTSCDMTSVKPVLVTEVYTARKLAGNPSDNAQQYKHQEFRASGLCAVHCGISETEKWAPTLEEQPY